MEVENIREYIAAKAESERDKVVMSNEIKSFAENIKGGMGDEIKKNVSYSKDNRFIRILKKLFNTCR